MNEMKALRIDFELVNPIAIPAYPIHLDGLLAWAAVQDGISQGIPMNVAQEKLPLARHGEGDDSVWMASWIDFAPGERDSMTFTRPFRVNDVVEDAGRSYHALRKKTWDADATSSPYKAYLIQIPLRHSKTASAWCIGDKSEVERLIATHISHLGKLSRVDLGRIRSVSVLEDPVALERWKHRTLTWSEPEYAKAFETTRAPYWKRENRREAWVPVK